MAEIRYPFGDKLRKVRERRELTMKEVARQAGVSESMVSLIERNKVSPSLDTLLTMAEVLQIDLEYLFQDYKKSHQVSIIRKNERNQVMKDHVLYEQLSSFSDNNEEHAIEAFLLTIGPGEEKGDQEYGHPGRELGYLMQGQGTLYYGKETYDLNSGDSISFRSDIPHRLENTGDQAIKALWVITPPRLFNN